MNVLGVLKIKVRKGINLAIRDTFCSDPYVVITMGGQVCYLLSLNSSHFIYYNRDLLVFILSHHLRDCCKQHQSIT